MSVEILIEDAAPEEKPVSAYTPIVLALAEADAAARAADPESPGKQATIKDVPRGDVSKVARAFGEAANAAGFTAKRRATLVGGTKVATDLSDVAADAEVTLVFVLGAKQERPRKPAAEEPAEVPAVPAKGRK